MTVRKTLYSGCTQESISLNDYPYAPSKDKSTCEFQWLDENVDYGTACAEGRKYATSIALYLKANPSLVGSNIISGIIEDMAAVKGSGTKGYRVGFCAFLEKMVYRFCCDHDGYRYYASVDET
jgi:hypothetical protein